MTISHHNSADEVAATARQDVRTRQILDAAATVMQRHGSQAASMKSIADEAQVSVGLIYRYYENKEALVRAVILDVLDQMNYQIPLALDPVEDPVRRVAAAFTAYAGVVRDKRKAVLLTYRETGNLNQESQDLVKSLELQTGQFMLRAVQGAIESGHFRDNLNPRLYSYNLLLIAHSWALKYWYFAERMSFEEFVSVQLSIVLHGALKPEFHRDYPDLLTEQH